jgi:hypothetical protein
MMKDRSDKELMMLIVSYVSALVQTEFNVWPSVGKKGRGPDPRPLLIQQESKPAPWVPHLASRLMRHNNATTLNPNWHKPPTSYKLSGALTSQASFWPLCNSAPFSFVAMRLFRMHLSTTPLSSHLVDRYWGVRYKNIF